MDLLWPDAAVIWKQFFVFTFGGLGINFIVYCLGYYAGALSRETQSWK